jgi:uncharacterized Zn finger protein
MSKKNTLRKQFSALTWSDLEEWAGSRIVGRGRSYQQQQRVSELSLTQDDALIAWVDGTEKYATKVNMDERGLPESICSCPYEMDCKHGVAVVLEYLKWMEKNRRLSKAKQDDERLALLAEKALCDNESDKAENALAEDMQKEIEFFLKDKTKAQFIDLICDLANRHPEMAEDLIDRQQMISGNIKALVTRLRNQIHDIGEEPGWQNYWAGEGYTPDYSGIRKKLELLLKAGHADDVLTLGHELVTTGSRQVEESNDEGETAMEIAACMPVIVKALARSSLDDVGKLSWALDAVLEDQFEVCEAFAEYLHRRHPQTAWHTFADRLLGRLKRFKGTKRADNFSRNYERDRLSDWAIHALEQAGREDEIIPLCVAEAKRTGSYDRLVKRLVAARRYEDAEQWIQEGIQAIKEKWPGIAADLRHKLLEIRSLEKNWPVVAAMQVEKFVRHPSRLAFVECKKASSKARVWTNVRESLLQYLEKGELPWKQKSWHLPKSGLDRPDVDQRNRFPLVDHLIDVAILEKKPDQVLRWYDHRPKDRFGRYGVDEDVVATAVQAHAPERAVAIWQNKAERLIAQVKPSAYHKAAGYLRKAAKVMLREKKPAEWEIYLKGLRNEHLRKRRLIEILDGLDGKPIVKNRR